jgi:methyl-accepting chemotaxis protein
MQHLANLTVNVDQSARQQSASLDQITNSVRDVDKVSEDNANNAEQTAAAAYELSSSAESMLTNIKRYKVA